MASLGPKKVAADKVLGPCVKIGQVLGSIGTKGSQTGTAYHAILIGLKSSNNLRWLNILIKIGTNQFWSAPRLLWLFKCSKTKLKKKIYF